MIEQTRRNFLTASGLAFAGAGFPEQVFYIFPENTLIRQKFNKRNC